jgi:hypothetical protein
MKPRGNFVVPEIIVLEFTAPEAAEIYRSVNRLLGLEEGSSDLGSWPAPLLSHVAGASGDKLIVVEAWESRAAQEEFMTQLGAAFEKASVPPPTRVEWFTPVGEMHRHGPMASVT